MSHSKMLTTRRRKARNKKHLAVMAKREKKLKNRGPNTAGAGEASPKG